MYVLFKKEVVPMAYHVFKLGIHGLISDAIKFMKLLSVQTSLHRISESTRTSEMEKTICFAALILGLP